MTNPRRGRWHRRPARALLAGCAVALLAGCGAVDIGVRGDADAPPAVDVGADPTTPGTAPTSPAEPRPTDGGDPAPSDPAAVDPCALVTRPEAERALGLPVQDAVAIAESCTYTAPPSGPTGQVEVYVADSAKNLLTAERALGHDIDPVPGIGDEAYAEDGMIFLNQGGVWVAIRLVRTDDLAKYRAALEGLARTAAGRL
ncbi:DUF3558 family protein [Micromonospora cathayae]|uniref:DUF3558 family protein n=1 Tax=Micromonospora cathayae TaxID=3028804 RepID=A0ABY7ZKQ6_9ACTN|nr:DUF3558 family protein [Micromonospora sp. HUAS 3]WDZ83462.1 DUF3558 family protein [Micromonospora sp. HUAS 3]